jgi:hypothetical protein
MFKVICQTNVLLVAANYESEPWRNLFSGVQTAASGNDKSGHGPVCASLCSLSLVFGLRGATKPVVSSHSWIVSFWLLWLHSHSLKSASVGPVSICSPRAASPRPSQILVHWNRWNFTHQQSTPQYTMTPCNNISSFQLNFKRSLAAFFQIFDVKIDRTYRGLFYSNFWLWNVIKLWSKMRKT